MNSMGDVCRHYQNNLRNSERAIGYLKSRGVSGKAAAEFRVGYSHPDSKDLIKAGFDPEWLKANGLLAQNVERGNCYERFRDRIMFPIFSADGAVIGFGGRQLDASNAPKYLNSPETPDFKKGEVLFGLYQASQAIAETDTAIVVEGYLDVIMLAQHGIRNSVATMGTALTRTNLEILVGRAKKVVFCFDGDAAGYKAAASALDICLALSGLGVSFSFLFLPGKHDPDSYVREFGSESFLALIDDAPDLMRFLIANLTSGLPLQHAEGRAALTARAGVKAGLISDPDLLDAMLREVSGLSGFTVEELVDLLGV